MNIVAICSDTTENHYELHQKHALKFSLLSDPTCEVLKAYEAYIDTRKNGQEFCEPALYILDNNGKVAYSVISSGPKGLPDPGAIVIQDI